MQQKLTRDFRYINESLPVAVVVEELENQKSFSYNELKMISSGKKILSHFFFFFTWQGLKNFD